MSDIEKDFFELSYENVIVKRCFKIWIGEIKETIAKEKWYWHKNDEDFGPSFPHLHSKNNPFKLDIYTGKVYNVKTKKVINNVNNNELKLLWANADFNNYVLEKRRYYQENIYDGKRYKNLPIINSFIDNID